MNLKSEVRRLNEQTKSELWELKPSCKKFPELWMTREAIIESFGVTEQTVDQWQYRFKNIKRGNKKRMEYDIAQIRDTFRRSYHTKPNYVLDRMCESIYFKLDEYLNDWQKAELLAELSGKTKATWQTWLAKFHFSFTDTTYEFVYWGRKMLTSPALRRMHNPKHFR